MRSDEDLVADWVSSLHVEQVADNSFISPSNGKDMRRWGASYMGQSLFAAARTSALQQPMSMQVVFLRAATWSQPLRLEVERLRDGRRLVTRCVRCFQNDKAVGICTLTFGETPGHLGHAPTRPDMPAPEGLGDWWQELGEHYAAGLGKRRSVWDLRSVGTLNKSQPPAQGELPWRRTWCHPRARLPDDPLVHAAAILAVSDTALTATVGLAYPKTRPTSLDHAFWWHGETRFDDWLLYATESPMGQGSRALIHGAFYARDGRRLASVTQECMVPDKPSEV